MIVTAKMLMETISRIYLDKHKPSKNKNTPNDSFYFSSWRFDTSQQNQTPR